MSIAQEITAHPEEYQIHEAVVFNPKEIIFDDEVRNLCEQNSCRGYGSCWACPPAVGSVKSCREETLQYKHALLFTTATKVEGQFNLRGWMDAREEHEKITEHIANSFRQEYPNALILSSEGCTICKDCTFPNEPCRFPDRMFPAVEGYGIFVMKLAPKVGIKYNNGKETITYFSMILF